MNSKKLLFERMHTIGGMPLNESDDWKKNINLIKNDFKSNIIEFNDDCYHGTKDPNSIFKIMVNGPRLYYHRELGIMGFSVSTNSQMIKYFGNGNGFRFTNVSLNLIQLPPIYYYLMASDTGIESDLWDSNSEMYKRATNLGFINRFNELGIIDQEGFIETIMNDPSLMNIDGFKLYEEDLGGSNEDEIILFQSGVNKAFSSQFYVIYDYTYRTREEFESFMKDYPEEVQDALNSEDEDEY